MKHSAFRVLAVAVFATVTGIYPARSGTASVTSSTAGSLQIIVQPTARNTPVLNLINNARQSIRLEIYLLTDRTIISALGRAHKRGVDVRVMIEQHPYGGNRSARLAYGALQAAGVHVHWANESAFVYTHEKAMVVDNRTAGIFSFNFTLSSFSRNREFGIIDTDPRDVSALAAIFDGDWMHRKPAFSDANLVVSPYNSRSDFQALIDSAKHTLDIYAEEVADRLVEGHIEQAVRRHVYVRLITSQATVGIDPLAKAGVAIKIIKSPYIHAKAIVADKARLFVGSENISATSLDKNREVGLLTSDRQLIGVVETTFAGDWSGAALVAPPQTPVGGSRALGVKVGANPSTLRRGQEVTIVASTKSGARCSIKVTYPDGYVSRSRALSGTKKASSDGSVTWSLRVGSTVKGTSKATVICSLGSATASGEATFIIQ